MKRATMWILVAVVALFYFGRRGLARAGTATVSRPPPKTSSGDQLAAAATNAGGKIIGAIGGKVASWFDGGGDGGSVEIGGSGPALDSAAGAYSDTTDSLGISL